MTNVTRFLYFLSESFFLFIYLQQNKNNFQWKRKLKKTIEAEKCKIIFNENVFLIGIMRNSISSTIKITELQNNIRFIKIIIKMKFRSNK